MKNYLNRDMLTIDQPFHPALDTDQLRLLYGDNIEDACELFGIFLDKTLADYYDLVAAIDRQDREEAIRLAHKIRNGFKAVGLTRLSNQIRDIEQQLKNEPDGKAAGEKASVFRKLFDRYYLPVVRAQYEHLKNIVPR